MVRAVEAYAIAVAFTVVAASVGMAIFHGQAFFVAMLGERFDSTFPGWIAAVGVAVASIPAAVVAAVIVRRRRPEAGASARAVIALASGAIWAAWFIAIGVAALALGVADPALDWNPALSVFDAAAAVGAGAIFAEVLGGGDADEMTATDSAGLAIETPAGDSEPASEP